MKSCVKVRGRYVRMTPTMTDQPKKPEPTPVPPTKKTSWGLVIPADWVDVTHDAVPFAIIGADHLRKRPPAPDKAPAPSPAPPETK
jgi:hypothetical protein